MTITAAADGSALGNPGPNGWAWYVDDANWAAGGSPHGTNNQGELKAVLELLRATAGTDESLLVMCDSRYVIDSITKWMPGWKRRGWRKADGGPVLNRDLMEALDEAMQGRDVKFAWVKGHAGHDLNEAADERANAAAKAYQRREEPQRGPGLTMGGAMPETVLAGTPASAPAGVGAPGGDARGRAGARAHAEAPATLWDDGDLLAEPDAAAPGAAAASAAVPGLSPADGQTGSERIPWSAGAWTHQPFSAEEDGGALLVTAVEGSDAWRHTSYGFVHDSEHALLTPFEPGTAMEVEFGTPFSQQFDQAGIFVRESTEHWVKAGIEFTDGVAHVGAVVTDGRSDWSATPVPEWTGARVTFRASWSGDAITIRTRREQGEWQLVRLLPFSASGPVQAGPFACAPTRAGLMVPFHGWHRSAPDSGLHV